MTHISRIYGRIYFLGRPPEDLWSFFDSFSPVHVAAMAPCMYHYGSPRNKVPFYGETGLNAGIMHMDLDRMRAMPDGWTGATMAMHDKYKAKIKLADQDILNILFRCGSFRLLGLYNMQQKLWYPQSRFQLVKRGDLLEANYMFPKNAP